MSPFQASLRAFLAPPSLKKLLQFGPSSSHIASFAAKAAASDDRNAKNASKKKKKEKARKDKKKTAKSSGPADGEQDRRRFDDLVVKALEAPSPVRHVKEKERQREKELAKYGLMTKERQVEVEQEKAREKAKEKAKKKAAGGASEEAEEEKPPLSAEEGKRLAKEYSRLLMREHRKASAGETLRLRLKKEAIEALPAKLKEAALVPDFTPFPGLSPATLTPPIPGFKYEYERQAETSEQ